MEWKEQGRKEWIEGSRRSRPKK